MMPAEQQKLFRSVQELIENAKSSIVKHVNSTMVLTYFQIGRMIVEDEQEGKTYAIYGKETITRLSQHLTDHFGKGYSPDNLERMRSFFIVYGNYETVSRNSKKLKANSASVMRNLQTDLNLSWTYYLQLLKIKDNEERKFYELETSQNNWSVRELQRQINSSYYERLALSRDKDGVKNSPKKVKLLSAQLIF